MGVWFFFSAIHDLSTTATIHLSGFMAGSTGFSTWLFASGVSIGFRVALGVGLILCAPFLSTRFYAEQVEPSESPSRVFGPGDIYRVACFVLGAFFFVSAAEPAGRVINAGFQYQQFSMNGSVMAGDVFTMIVYLSAGVFLTFGSQRIGEMLSSMRYDPESIPNQQYSVKLLMILTGLVAVLLGVLRWWSLG